MVTRLRSVARVSRFRALVIVLTMLTLIATGAPQMCGADLAEQVHSLRSVPADAAFYSASLRLKEQFDALVGSKAYGKLMEIPVIQLVKMQAAFQWKESPQPTVAGLRKYFESPEGEDTIAVLKEMFSTEMFVYGGNDIAEAVKLFIELNALRRSARLEALARGEDPDEVASEQMLEALNERAKQFKVPTMLFGFRIANAELAKGQLDELHSLLRNLLDEHQPELAAHLQRDQLAGHEFLTLRLDGSMIPWDKLDENADEEDELQIEQWRQVVSEKTLAVALGVVDEFVLVSLGESTDHLETIGEGPFLIEQPAIKRLAKHADQRVVSIGYMSQTFAQSISSPQQTVEDVAGAVEEILGAAEVSEGERTLIIDDIRALNLEKYVPAAGETASVAYLTPRGYEGFQYSSAQRPMADSSRPLTILNHAGGSPALVIASRSKENIEDYDETVAWLKRTAPHVEQVIESKADPDDWARYQEFRGRVVELLKRLDAANREHLLPALADGQGAVVMDFSTTSTQWFKQMPESPKPLPMPELAFGVGVTDAEKLRQGTAEYIGVLQDVIKLLHEINPEETPDIELPTAQKRDISSGGKMYVYPLPKVWGIDSQVAVNAGLGDNVAVVSTMPATTERLMQESPLAVDTALKLDRPAAMVVHVEFAKAIEATRPWIDYGFDVAMGKIKVKEDEDEGKDESDEGPPAEQNPVMLSMGFIVPQVHQFLEVATALKSASAVNYEEDGVWVTHSETHIEDLK